MSKAVNDISGELVSQNWFILGLKKRYPLLILGVLAYLAISAISFLGVSRNVTVAALALDEYEVGQIAEKTIIAERTLPSTMDYPVVVLEGEKITRKGFPITEEGYRKLEKMANTREYIDYRAYVNTLIFLAIIGVLWVFLFSPVLLGRRARLNELVTEAIFFMAIYAATLFGSKLPFTNGSPYFLCILIPSSLFIFLITILFGEKSALFFTILCTLGVLNASGYDVIVSLYVFATCLSSARIVRRVERRTDMVFVAIISAMLNIVFIFLLKVIFNDAFENILVLMAGLAINGFFSGILTLGFVTPLEQILNTASVFRLMDLSDTNNAIMQKMLVNASGTYNHSMMVASLAENACKAIGANALLARVGAFYHDIGKLDQSEYFVENNGGENKHEDLNPSLSVSIIRSHVKKGVEKARQLRLPPQIIDIIGEHHGNDVIGFFYAQAKKENEEVDSSSYSYFGNPPTSRESAVVMLADTVEAACRTLTDPSVPRLEKFIGTLVASKLERHQLDNSDLTFRDLTVIKEKFVTILAGYYHVRIKYPDQKDPDDNSNTASSEEVKENKKEKNEKPEVQDNTEEKTVEKKGKRGKNA